MSKTIISYSRVSSAKQVAGTGLSQQKDKEMLDTLSIELGIPIDSREFSDAGKSGYHSKNLEGDFGKLLNLIDDGSIVKGSVIAITSLDRISRAKTNKAMELMLSVINRGIRIYTAMDGKLYSDDSPNLTADLIVSVIIMSQAHEESHKKSVRIKGANTKMIEAFLDGERGKDGYPKAISGGRLPWWVASIDSQIREDKIYFPIVKDAIKKMFDGYGTNRLTEYLNDTYAAPQGRGKWSRSTVAKIHTYTALTGVLNITSDGKEYSLQDYYPRVLSDGEYQRLLKMKNGKQYSRTASEIVPLLTGNKVAKCGVCGSSLASATSATGYRSYRCMSKQNRGKSYCSSSAVPAALIDRVVFGLIEDVSFTEKESKEIEGNPIQTLKDELEALENRLGELLEAYEEGTLPKTLFPKMNRVELDIETKKQELKQAQIALPQDIDELELVRRWSNATAECIDNPKATDDRLALKELITDSVNSVTVRRSNRSKVYNVVVELVTGEQRYAIIEGDTVIEQSFTLPELHHVRKRALGNMLDRYITENSDKDL
ncbi:recombinase family protein [Vibrio splendidus]|uniref:recombinase family protein n=1 Tax=Vibrio splendidus TaxID=29497 RepID=UPI000D361C0F|nr:recombinase family protein [Vibrio splendidus]PTP95458.1 hypothetical protein CWO02_01045 [Vibrio splendidus]